MFGYGAQTSVSISMRSSTVNRLDLRLLISTPTVTSSNSADARVKTSMCPLVTGSNDPGQTALTMRSPQG